MGRYRRIQRPRFTDLGSPFIELINKTGSASVKGTLISAGSASESFIIPTVPYDVIGVVYETGKADGSYCKVVIGGLCEGLLQDNTTAGVGGWLRASSDVLGRIVNTTGPEGLGALAADDHFKEIGHCLTQIVTSDAGASKLVKFILHLN